MTDAQPNTSRDRTAATIVTRASETTSFLTVFVDEQIYGLDVKEAGAVFKAGQITPIPLARKEVRGFINLRGQIVVAVSLRRRLGLDETGCQESEKFAVGLEAANEHFALLVSRVGEVVALPDSARSESPAHFSGSQSLFTRDFYLLGSKHIPILDVSRLFDFSL